MKVDDKNARKSFPHLKAKAWETKVSIPAMLSIWKARMDRTKQEHRWVEKGLENCLEIENILFASRDQWTLDDSTCAALTQAAVRYLTFSRALQNFFANQGLCLFQTGTFKGHWLLHACQMSRHIHPLQVDAYSGEDFMHVMKCLMQSCLVSRSPISSMRHFMVRYCRAFHFQITISTKGWKLK